MSKKGSITTADYLPYKDYQKLVKNLLDSGRYWWATYCILAFSTGLRFSDLSTIKWKDILGERRLLITAKKTGKTHSIPIGQNASDHFSSLYEKLGKPDLDSYVLSRNEKKFGKGPVSIQYINHVLKNFAIKYNLDIENFSTHTFRKTFGRYVYESNGKSESALLYLNSIFKHRDLATTRIYLGFREDEIGTIFSNLVSI